MGEEECLVFAVSADLGVGVCDTAGVGLVHTQDTFSGITR